MSNCAFGTPQQTEVFHSVSNSTQDSPNNHGVMGSKSVGEPPLLLSASVLSAFQAAVAAAKADLAHQHKGALAAANGTAEAQVRSYLCSHCCVAR